MLNEADEVPTLLSAKLGSKYTGRDLDAMKAVAGAFHDRSLKQYYKVHFQDFVGIEKALKQLTRKNRNTYT